MPDQNTRPALRVFISSTAVDLREYREKVRDAILSLDNVPVAMENFSAQPGQPASECQRMAAQADAVICIVAHRYSYVPPPDLGGDGERSITWLEVEAARKSGKPVLAFLVDPAAAWTGVREQDRLTSEPPEKALEIVKAVQKLQEFKAWLMREYVCRFFTNPDDLATYVTAAVSRLTPASNARIWQPLFCHALQPAQHFRGRPVKLGELKDWLEAPVTPDRVVSVVAAGGTGKTALVNEAVHQAKFSGRAGLFIWSFYEDPHTDAFLRSAWIYFTGEKDAPASGMLERLLLALAGDTPHVLILDGLERVQSEGGHRRRGELEDLPLKRLVKALAGGIGSARALVTSRFPLVDLDEFTGAGHRAIVLDDLAQPVALEVLRAWNVKGGDAAILRLIEPLNVNGAYHALSIAVLGSYVGNFAGGDPNRAPAFSLNDPGASNPKARRLNRILEEYVKVLAPEERALLARLSLFPRGVRVEFLGWIVQSGGDVAGALIGLGDRQLAAHLERLKGLGLVFRYETDGQPAYSAHPFLRDFFRDLLETKAESVHESVRARLAPRLEARPATKPSDPATLDRYELLIEQTLLAGRVQDAFDLYWYGLGGGRNIGWALGESTRGLRILERFASHDGFPAVESQLTLRKRLQLANGIGLFASNLGDVTRARSAYAWCLAADATGSDPEWRYRAQLNLAGLEVETGCFPQAVGYCESLLSATEASEDEIVRLAFACRASAHFALGHMPAAAADYRVASERGGGVLLSSQGIDEAESRMRRGDRAGALTQTTANLQFAIQTGRTTILCLCHALLARLVRKDDGAQAIKYLEAARAFANRSGHVEVQLRCAHAATELYHSLGDSNQAITEAEAGILLADTCGFGKYSVDIRLALAETYLSASEPRKALQNARNALDRSEHPDCRYAWGRADALHFCGLAHQRLNEPELARQRLTAALELRESLGHGRAEETRRALN